MTPKRMLVFVMTVLAAMLAALAAGLPVQTPAAQAGALEQDSTGTHVVYLALMARSPAWIYGRVTEGGQSAGGVTVSLRYYNGAAWSIKATAQTNGEGRFQFGDQPSLGGGQKYQVTFDNTSGSDNRLAWWGTRHLTSYTYGANAHIGDFDIAAVHLNEPAHQATVGLPAAFRWHRRGATNSDSYAMRVYDTGDLNPLYVSPYVGYGDSFTLSSLPGGFTHATAYTWDVIILAPDGATGVSRAARTVRFNGGIHGRVLQNGSAVGGVPLQLRFFNGSSWSTVASTTTASDGTYAFTSATSLGHGQKYYVRYQNVTQTAGRLFLWSTRSLTAYTAGTALDLGSFDIADVALVGPSGGATLSVPTVFQWTRRGATPTDGYILELYDPSDYQPRWLSPLLGYAESYLLNGLAPALSVGTPYAWDVIITSPDGGSGVSRMARLVQFTNRGAQSFDALGADWPFDEELPERPAEEIEGEELLDSADDQSVVGPVGSDGAASEDTAAEAGSGSEGEESEGEDGTEDTNPETKDVTVDEP